MENFATYHYEAKTQLNKYNMHALLKLEGGVLSSEVYKGGNLCLQTNRHAQQYKWIPESTDCTDTFKNIDIDRKYF